MANAPDGRVDVLWARPADVLAAAGAAALLDDAERSRLARLRRPADRARFAAAHALLRIAVGRFARTDPAAVVVTPVCPTCGGPHGRPTVTVGWTPEPQVTLSHSGDRVVVAVTLAGAVGVDVEPLDADAFADDGMDRMVLTGPERAAVEACAPPDRAHARAHLWVRKEALLKATGQGLQIPLSQVAVADGTPVGPAAGARWADLDLGPGYTACLAVLSPAEVSVVVERFGVGT